MLKNKAYDLLFGDDEGTQIRYSFIKPYLTEGTLLEVGCGSGDLLNQLSLEFEVTGIDKDESMIHQTIHKYPNLKENLINEDFIDASLPQFNQIVCLGDSLNYMMNKESVKQFLDKTMNHSDRIILDMHHPYRLIEFANGYEEEGSVEGLEYGYQINVEDDYLIHIINYFDGTYDIVEQWVFDPKEVIKYYQKRGYKVEVFTDFKKGYLEIGEKIMLVITGEKS